MSALLVSGALATVDVEDLAGDQRRGLQRPPGGQVVGVQGVAMWPGEMALTRILLRAYSIASDLVARLST